MGPYLLKPNSDNDEYNTIINTDLLDPKIVFQLKVYGQSTKAIKTICDIKGQNITF